MMRLLSLELINIKAHRSASFDFAEGINVLAGPNGVGKSTLFEAIGYALFGLEARDFVSRADRFVTIGEKRGEVRVGFLAEDGSEWQVTRTVGTNSRWLLAQRHGDEFLVEEHANAGETERRLRELLGLSPSRPLAEQFRLIIGPLQSEFLGPFVIRSATERQKIFDAVLGIDSWRKTFEGTSRLQSTLEHRCDKLQSTISLRSEQTAALPTKREALQSQLDLKSAKRQDLENKEKQLTEVQSELARLDQARQRIDTLQADIGRLQERQKAGRDKIQLQQERVAEAKQATSVVEQTAIGAANFQQAQQRLQQLQMDDRQRRELQKTITAKDKDHARLVQAKDHEATEISKLRQQLLDEEQHLQKTLDSLQPDSVKEELARTLPEYRQQLDQRRHQAGLLAGQRNSLEEGQQRLQGGQCPFFLEPCRNLQDRPLGDIFPERLAELQSQQERLQQELAQFTRQVTSGEEAAKSLAALQVQRSELQRQLARLEQRHQDVAKREREQASLVEKLTNAAAELSALQQQEHRFAGLDQALEQCQEELRRWQGDRDRHQASLALAADLGPRQETLQRYESLLAEIVAQCQALQEESNRLQSSYQADHHEQLKKERDGLLAARAALQQELSNLSQDVQRIQREMAELEALEQEVRRLKQDLRQNREQEKLLKFLRSQVFKNVSNTLAQRYREAISRRADRIYRTIAASDEELAWGDNYQIILRDLQGGQLRERSDDQLSGGQMMSAVVALRLALLQTIGARIAFFDEPTASLDAQRRENLAEAFRAIDVGQGEVTEHWYDQLFLISHDVAFTEITDQMIELGGPATADSPAPLFASE